MKLTRDSRDPERNKLKHQQKQQQSTKLVWIVAGFSAVMFIVGLSVWVQLSNREEAHAAASGDYRSKTSGSWATAGNWEKYNGTSWATATTAPNSSNGVIEIQNGHTMTISAAVTADQIVVDTGGVLTISSNTLSLANGSGTDMTIYGTVNVSGNMTGSASATVNVTSNGILELKTSSNTTIGTTGGNIAVNGLFKRSGGTFNLNGTMTVNNGGTYEHAMNANAIPTATWNTGATVKISGITSTLCTGLGQSFYNFTWSCASQSSNMNLNAALSTVNGSMTVTNTGTKKLYFDQQGNNSTTAIGGNLNINGGTTFVCINGSATVNVGGNLNVTAGNLNFNEAGGNAYGNTSGTINVTGDLNASGGTLDLSQYDGANSSKGIGVLNLTGNFNATSTASITETSTVSKGKVNFAGSGTHLFTNTNHTTQVVDFTVNSGNILDMNGYVMSGAGAFTLSSTAGLLIRQAAGITNTSASGDIQVTGTRSYNTGADYSYLGTVTQNTGDGLPATVRNLTFDNAQNITLTNTVSASGTLSLTNGLITASNDTLILGTSTSTVGTLARTNGYVNGYFQRWLNATTTSNVLFPIGTATTYNAGTFNFTVTGTSGYLVSNFVFGEPGNEGLPLDDAGTSLTGVGAGLWNFAPGGGFSGWTHSVNLQATGMPGINDYTTLRIIQRAGSGSSWTVNGTHSAGTGSNSSPVANRTGMTSFNQFGISSGSGNSLPIKLTSWTAQLKNEQVALAWTTASERDNDYFTVERSQDGKQFSEVTRVPGAGNSSTMRKYSATDLQPLAGKSYYRLKQTDFDGKYTYSKIAVITTAEAARPTAEFKLNNVFPNPFQNRFSADIYSPFETSAEIELLSLSGVRVYHTSYQFGQGDNRYEFEDSMGLPVGQYLLRIKVGDKSYVKKLVKS